MKNKRKYIYLHQSNDKVDNSSFSFFIRFTDYHKKEFFLTSVNYKYLVDKNNKKNPSIATFFIQLD
ncbi:hypothetical protein HYT02_04950 [Candidatus Gottesmanbacteria bacterium]|nr:hypothetical protein [Candidatus Gottesmanbacteria bacterium]